VVQVHGGVPGRPAAGKTGTQQYGDTPDNSDAWMAGYTPQLATVVWIGRAQPGPIRDASGQRIEGEGLPMTLWRDFLSAALAGQPSVPLPRPAFLGDGRAGDLTVPEPGVGHRQPPPSAAAHPSAVTRPSPGARPSTATGPSVPSRRTRP